MTIDPNSRIDELIAKGEAADGKPKPSAKRGLLDFIAVSMAIYGMVVTTPVGGLMVRGFNFVFGTHTKTRPLVSYFTTDGVGGGPAPQLAKITKRPTDKSSTSKVAKKVGLSPELARAAAIIASGGEEDADGYHEVRLLAGGVSTFAAIGAPYPGSTALAKDREEAYLRGLAELNRRFGAEAALAATTIELSHVEYAIDRAKKSGSRHPVPYRVMRAFLPPEHRDEADNTVNGAMALATAYSMIWPADVNKRITSPFGYRMHPVLGTRKLHRGMDIALPNGSKVFAVADGTIKYAAFDSANGNFVKIDHGFGLTSAYCHNSELKVGRGDRVLSGDRIADSGSTGRSTGPHLHFQLELNGKAVDPELFINRTAATAARTVAPATRLAGR